MPLIVDPGLYLNTKKDIYWVSPKRTLPTAFKLFTGNFFYSLHKYLFNFAYLMIYDCLNHHVKGPEKTSLYFFFFQRPELFS